MSSTCAAHIERQRAESLNRVDDEADAARAARRADAIEIARRTPVAKPTHDSGEPRGTSFPSSAASSASSSRSPSRAGTVCSVKPRSRDAAIHG